MSNEKTERRYGEWAGNPKGHPENTTRCIVEGRFMFPQCYRKRGHGKDGLYCKQHAKLNPVEPPK